MELIANESVAIIGRWMESVGLALTEHKTEVLLVGKRKKMEQIKIKVGRQEVESKDENKYWGVMLDSRLNFKAHVKYACGKVSKSYAGLARMLANTDGPRSIKTLFDFYLFIHHSTNAYDMECLLIHYSIQHFNAQRSRILFCEIVV